ncbi:MAG TPA: hypothetical protein VGG10_08785 [Rhizomicrobium sp.]|jgi:hypothetical protein
MTAVHLGFEGLVGYGQSAPLTTYDGFTFDNMGAVNKYWGFVNGYGNNNGFYTVAHYHTAAYTAETIPGHTEGTISSTTEFTLRSGMFASVWQAGGEEVKFTAMRNGVAVGNMKVDLTITPQEIVFNHHFKDIDAVVITATSGTGNDSNVSMDRLKFLIPDSSGSHADPATVASAHAAIGDTHLDDSLSALHLGALHHDWAL